MTELKFSIGSGERGFPWDTAIGLMPHVVWAAVALIALRWIGISTIRSAVARLSKVGVAGLEFEFREEVEAAIKARGQPATTGQVDRIARRLAASAHLLLGARILWVDDEPYNNALEARLLRDAGAVVVLARSTTDAIDAAIRTSFNLVISDITRGDDVEAGLRMPGELAARAGALPVIYYVGEARKPAPPDAFGIADRPDELLHLVLDSLARCRG